MTFSRGRKRFSLRFVDDHRQNWMHWFTTSRCQWLITTGLILGFFLFICHGGSWSSYGEQLSFVTVSGTRLEADCRPFRIVGFNTHDLIQAATMTTYDFTMRNGKSGRARVREMLRKASASKLNVIRTWAHTNDPASPFQTRPGNYDTQTLASLDYILDEARRYGIRVILSFVDNWKYYNGVDQYVDWSRTAPRRTQQRPVDRKGDPSPQDYDNEQIKRYEAERHALFYTDEGAKQIFKNHIKTIVNWRNQANGVIYKNDPTILAWDLINEPRCETWAVANCAQMLQEWIDEMSSYLKTQDSNHLVTIGAEGFYSKDSKYRSMNPQDWGYMLGQDWIRNHQSKNIDFLTVHIWPDNWNRTDLEFQKEWIQSHIEAAKELKKPVLIEEFGKRLNSPESDEIETIRNPVYTQVYSLIEQSINQGHDVYGSLFWRWNMPLFDDKQRGEYGVQPSDSTFEIIQKHAAFIHSITNAVPSRGDCMRQCWVPHDSAKRCILKPEVCQAVWSLDCDRIYGNLTERTVTLNGVEKKLSEMKIFPSKRDCCLPGLGAFKHGCSWTLM
eukprot:g7172.t1